MKKITKTLFVSPKADIRETMRAIDKNGYGIALIADSSERLLGVVTDGDIRRAILHGADIQEPVSSIMTKEPLAVSAAWNKPELEKFLRQHTDPLEGAVTKVPVLDKRGHIVDLLFYSRREYYFLNRENHKTLSLRKTVKRILVVGGAGFIGSRLVRLLLDSGYRVTVLDLFLYGDRSLRDIKSNKNLNIIKGDTRHIEDVAKSLQDVDAVVHLAELVGDPACALDPKTTQEINYFATSQLAAMCKRLQINRLVYFSSCSVYGASGQGSCTETSELSPVSLYAKMKVGAERALLECADENFTPTILRLATVYGASFRPRFDLVVNLLTAKALINKEIPIFGGSQWRPHVHVQDVCRAVLKVLEAPGEKVGGEIFNVGSNTQNHTILEVGKKIKRLIPDANLQIRDSGTDRRNYRVDFSKIERCLGFKALMKIEDGVREVVQLLESGIVKDHTAKQYSNIQMLQQKN